ncbi:MarR family winged helix-turn-helix transcriptional regulator [Saccharomonospora halophila]|uniref:MarR family winged helix-turn-helix transcriptional regulator n=1 Tax=Saccharomonospora halophila TaxID=129922 RepID=UPI000368D5CC|nr:MarR family transcriptional regulator [Saccharomonospora halophila]
MEKYMNFPELTDDVGFLLSRASGLAVRGANAALGEYGLRVRQYSVLALAVRAPDGISQRELADTLGLDPSQVVLLVDELVGAGLVERRPAPSDRRTRLVVATGEGERVRHRAGERVWADTRHRLRALSDAEQDTLRELLARIVDTADSDGGNR